MSDPWFFTRAMLRSRLSFIRGRTLDLGAGEQKYRSLVEQACSQYISIDAFSETDVRGDASTLPFKADVFDTIVCTQVIEHLQTPWVAMQEIHRILKPGGHLLLSAPFLYPYHGSPYDYFRYTKEGLITLLKHGELQVVKIESMGSPRLVFVEYLSHVAGNNRIKRRLVSALHRIVAATEREGREHPNTDNHFVVARK